MQKFWQKITSIPLLKKLNQHRFMPVIWWTLLIIVLQYFLSLIRVPIVWRVSLFSFIINSIIAYHVGSFITKRSLPVWWIFFLPIVFDLLMIIKFANYNLVFGLIYLIMELFGLFNRNVYR